MCAGEERQNFANVRSYPDSDLNFCAAANAAMCQSRRFAPQKNGELFFKIDAYTSN
jgi:hypothetical protein